MNNRIARAVVVGVLSWFWIISIVNILGVEVAFKFPVFKFGLYPVLIVLGEFFLYFYCLYLP